MKKCYIYTRVSTSEQNKGAFTSVENQEKSCMHFIGIREEEKWQHVKTISDPGFSGKDLDRPGMIQLMSEIKSGNVDILVTYKVDRVSRSLVKFYEFHKLLQKYNVEFVSATQSFDTSTSSGRLMLNILLSFAEYEREIISERTRDKMFANFDRGEWHGGLIPFGFDYNKKEKLLTKNPRESEAVEIVFKMLSQNKSSGEVARYLNTSGYKTKKRKMTRNGKTIDAGGKRIREDFVLKIARNPIYCGYLKFNNEVKKGKHGPIVKKSLFDKVNKQRSVKKETNGSYNVDNHVHLLKGLIKCKDCGSTMTPFPSGKKYADGTPYLYYTCTDVIHNKTDSKCKLRTLSARTFENTIKKYLENLGKDKAVLDQSIKSANKLSKKSLKPLLAKKDDFQVKKKSLSTKINRLIDIMAEKDFVASDIKDKYKNLIKEKEIIEQELEKVYIEIDFKQRDVLNTEIIQKSLKSFSEIIDNTSLENQKELMQLLIKEIRVSPFDPQKEKPSKELRAISLKIRNKWIKTEIDLYEISVPPTTYDDVTKKFVFSSKWLPREDSNLGQAG